MKCRTPRRRSWGFLVEGERRGGNSKVNKPIDGSARYGAFRALAEYAMGLLDEKGRRLLKIRAGDRSLDFSERLIRRREWDRYLSPASKEDWDRRREGIKWVLDRLDFLFGSGVPDHIVGHLVTEAILDVTTLGSQCWHLRAKTLEWRGRRRGTYNPVGDGGIFNGFLLLRMQHICIARFRVRLPILQEQYPQMTPENLVQGLGKRGVRVFKSWFFVGNKSLKALAASHKAIRIMGTEFTFFEQLTFRYAYYLLKTHREYDYEFWFEGILKRHRWHLEKIALSNGAWNQNKYREGFLRLLSEELTGDSQRSKYQDCVFLSKKAGRRVVIEKNEGAEGIIETVLGCFGEERLRLLESKDSRGNSWSFGDQLRDRFSYRRPSFASMEEIGEHVRRKVSLYGPLINGETAEAIGDILLDDFDGELFVSEATHLWNREMETNSEEVDSEVLWAVDRILESIDASLWEKLPKNLRNMLLARWKRARLAGNRVRFQKFLDELHIHTIHCPHYWTQESLSSVELQAFMGQLDPMFLYPREGRIFKLLGNRNDVGLALGKRRDGRYMPLNLPSLCFSLLMTLWAMCLLTVAGLYAAKYGKYGRLRRRSM